MSTKSPVPISSIQTLCAALQDLDTAISEGFIVEELILKVTTHTDPSLSHTIIAQLGEHEPELRFE